MVRRRCMDWNTASLWLSLINIYDCRRKLNKVNGVILSSLWSRLAGLTTNSEARKKWECCGDGWCGFSFLHFPIHFLCYVRPLMLTSQHAMVTASLIFYLRFLFLWDWLSEGRFSFLRGRGLCPKTLALEPSVIALLGVSMVYICYLLILCMAQSFQFFFHLGSWRLMR